MRIRRYHEQLIAVFEDTQVYYTENPTLAEAVKESRDHTVFLPAPRRADDYPELPEFWHEGRIAVTISKTFQAAMEQSKRIPASGSPC